MPIIFNMSHFGNLCSSSKGCAMTVTVQEYFRRILATPWYLGTHEWKKFVKSAENVPAR